MLALKLLETKRPEIELLCKKYAVKSLRIIGSAVTNRWDPSSSDFDFLVHFDPPPESMNGFHQYFDFLNELQLVLGHNIDLIEDVAVKGPRFDPELVQDEMEWYAA